MLSVEAVGASAMLEEGKLLGPVGGSKICWGCMAECGTSGSESGFGHASNLLICLRLCFIETDSFARLLISVASPIHCLPSAYLTPGTIGLMKLDIPFSQQLDFCS